MPVRKATVAGMFYPADQRRCSLAVEQALSGLAGIAERRIVGGIVPHAGWVYSGRCAGHLFAALRDRAEAPETVVLFGAVHTFGVDKASLYGAGSWRTPLGDLEIDHELAQAALARDDESLLLDHPQAHNREHSIEVQLPFVKHIWPDARILPISISPVPESVRVGRIVAQAIQSLGRDIVVIGSSDLTHYGPRYGMAPAGTGKPALDWTHANDKRLLDQAAAMRPVEVLHEARAHHNACGAGAIAATIACCAQLGAGQGQLLCYTTSHEVRPSGPAGDLVGYGAVAYWA